jgi:hypothetical protein
MIGNGTEMISNMRCTVMAKPEILIEGMKKQKEKKKAMTISKYMNKIGNGVNTNGRRKVSGT